MNAPTASLKQSKAPPEHLAPFGLGHRVLWERERGNGGWGGEGRERE